MDESQIREGEYVGYRVSVRLVREGDREFRPRALNSSREAYEFYRALSSLDREAFYSTHLDQRNQVLSCEEISRGTLSASLVHPREVFKAAILSSAAGIIISHNHPSGNPAPSREDWELTSRLAEAGRLLGIPLLDSIIIGHERYYSMRDEGRL